MATFSQIKTRVLNWVIDAPSAVQSEVPTLVNAAIFWLQSKHNFQVMQAEAPYTTSSTPALGSNQTHIFGQIPSDWKCQRDENPYYVLFIGGTRMLFWQASRSYMYRMWNPADLNQVGPPHDLLIGEPSNSSFPDPLNPDNSMTALNLEVYPFPDGSSDWSDGNYRLRIPYYRYLPALSADGDHNWFTTDGNQAEFVVAHATWQAMMMDWNEQRAGAHKVRAVGAAYDGSTDRSLGGLARAVIDQDKGILQMPGRELAMRRDVYAPRDQWRNG